MKGITVEWLSCDDTFFNDPCPLFRLIDPMERDGAFVLFGHSADADSSHLPGGTHTHMSQSTQFMD